MSHCGHEHHHNHDGHTHDDDDHLTAEGEQNSLYGVIDKDGVQALNEHEPGAGSRIIKPWSERNSTAEYLESSVDDALLIRIPFVASASIRIRSLVLKAGPAEHTPDAIHLFTNCEPALDFADADDRSELPKTHAKAPAQSLLNIAVANDVVEYPLRTAKFSNVRDVTLYIPKSMSGDKTRIYFVSFKGDWDKVNRQAPANIVYEATPQLKDHTKVAGTESGSHSLGQ